MDIQIKRSENGKEGLHNLCRYLALHIDLDSTVEIGSWIGESARIFSQYFGEVICVDPWEGLDDVYQAFLDNTKDIKNITHLRYTSMEAMIPENMSFVYIDGKHTYENVKEDILKWSGKAKIIGGHDYHMPGVARAVDSIFGKPCITFQDTSWVGKI